jgi:hypothetical protein
MWNGLHASILGLTQGEVCDGAEIVSEAFRNGTRGKVPTSRQGREKWGTRRNVFRREWPDLLERFDRRSFVVFHDEDGVELGDLKQVVDFLSEVQQLEFATLILGGGEGADQFTDA